VRVNSSSLRAVGEVRGIHGNSEAGIPFIYLSRGGKDLLADLIAELARLRNHSASNWRAENVWRQLERAALFSGGTSARGEFGNGSSLFRWRGVKQGRAAACNPCPSVPLAIQTAINTTPAATSKAAIHRRRPTRSCRNMRAATALATKVNEAEAGTTRLRFPHERPKSRL
jgi:hypothetical protein